MTTPAQAFLEKHWPLEGEPLGATHYLRTLKAWEAEYAAAIADRWFEFHKATPEQREQGLVESEVAS